MSETVPNRSASGASRPPSRRPAPPSSRPEPVPRTAKDYLILFRERWYWGMAAALLLGGGLAVFEMLLAPTYSTTSKLLFENPITILDTIKPVSPESAEEVNLETHIQQIRSASFQSSLVASFTPAEVERLREPYLKPELPADEQPSISDIVAESLDVVAQRDAPIIEITAVHRTAWGAEAIANHCAQRYIEFNRLGTASSTNSAVLTLQDEERKLRQQLTEAQARLEEFRRQHNTTSLADNQNVVVQRLNSISQQLITARAEARDLETTLHQVDEFQKNGRNLAELAYVANFGSVPTLLRDIDALQGDRAVLDQRYGENHPKMRENAEALRAKNDLLKENIARAVAELRARYDRAAQHVARVQEQQRESEEEALQLQRLAGDYEVLTREKDGTSSLYDEVQRRLKEAVLQTQLDVVSIKILDKAPLPWEPADPNPRKVILHAVLVGGFFLFIVPIGLGMIDVRLKAAWEVEQFLHQNLMGEIPSIVGVPRKERPHIMAKDLDHAASEAFRGLFGQLQLNSTVPYPKVLMISSTLPGEGKSMVANNLAATFASHGKKTLLVDFDFRRPNLHLYYGKDNACGVLRWLNAWNGAITGPVEEDPDLGVLPVKQNLFLLRAGGEHRRATELFETDAFARLLQALRQQFEIVVVDTPPLGVFPDAMLISRKCDEVLYVCRFNAVNRSKVRKSLDRLKKSEAVVAGIVLNGLPSGKQSAYYDYYGYGSNENKRYKAYYAQKR